jgi:hypothetical protein
VRGWGRARPRRTSEHDPACLLAPGRWPQGMGARKETEEKITLFRGGEDKVDLWFKIKNNFLE